MSQFSEKIKAHYAGVQLGTVEVPEWGMTLYVRPATIGQSAAILQETDQFRQACKLIQVRAKDEHGKPVFDETDFNSMITYGDVSLINRIVEDIVKIGDIEEDEGKKP